MHIEEACPECQSSKVYLVHGGYLCWDCETRLVRSDNAMIAVTDFASITPLKTKDAA